MAVVYDQFYYNFPPVIVDHMHQRTHQHQKFYQYLTGHHSRAEDYPNTPDVDVRDTAKEYQVEVEVPGVSSPEDITVVWTSNHNAIVVGDVKRPQYQDGKGTENLSEEHANQGQDDKDGAPLHKTLTRDAPGQFKDGEQPGTVLLVGERRIGSFRRYFTFPTAVDHHAAIVKLEAGLLKLRVPKQTANTFKATTAKIRVEDA